MFWGTRWLEKELDLLLFSGAQESAQKENGEQMDNNPIADWGWDLVIKLVITGVTIWTLAMIWMIIKATVSALITVHGL